MTEKIKDMDEEEQRKQEAYKELRERCLALGIKEEDIWSYEKFCAHYMTEEEWKMEQERREEYGYTAFEDDEWPPY